MDETRQSGGSPVARDAAGHTTAHHGAARDGALRDGAARDGAARDGQDPEHADWHARRMGTGWSSAGAALEPESHPVPHVWQEAPTSWNRATQAGLRGNTDGIRYSDLLTPLGPRPSGIPASSAPPYPYEGDLEDQRQGAVDDDRDPWAPASARRAAAWGRSDQGVAADAMAQPVPTPPMNGVPVPVPPMHIPSANTPPVSAGPAHAPPAHVPPHERAAGPVPVSGGARLPVDVPEQAVSGGPVSGAAGGDPTASDDTQGYGSKPGHGSKPGYVDYDPYGMPDLASPTTDDDLPALAATAAARAVWGTHPRLDPERPPPDSALVIDETSAAGPAPLDPPVTDVASPALTPMSAALAASAGVAAATVEGLAADQAAVQAAYSDAVGPRSGAVPVRAGPYPAEGTLHDREGTGRDGTDHDAIDHGVVDSDNIDRGVTAAGGRDFGALDSGAGDDWRDSPARPGWGRSTPEPPFGPPTPIGQPSLADFPATSARPTSSPPVSGYPGQPLPQRVPAPPDVPEVPDDEPGTHYPEAERGSAALAPPELARIATRLRDDEGFVNQPAPPEELDVNAVLAAVREVDGVRDAKLVANPGGVHTLRLDLADGADPGQVSRLVARLLKRRMGLAAEPRRTSTRPDGRDRGDNTTGDNTTGDGVAGVATRGGSAHKDIDPDDIARGDAVRGDAVRGDAARGDAARGGATRGGAGSFDAYAGPPPAASPAHGRSGSRLICDPDEGDGQGWAVGSRGMSGAPPAPRTPVTSVRPTSGPAGGSDDRARRTLLTPPRGRVSPEGHGDSGSGLDLSRTGRAVSGARVVIDQVQVSTLGLDATVEVRLTNGAHPAVGVASGPAVDGYVLRLAAVAATLAVDQLLATTDMWGDQPGRCFVENAAVVPFGSCEVAVVVVLLVCNGVAEQLAGAAVVAGDPRQAVVRATLSAINRRLDALLG